MHLNNAFKKNNYSMKTIATLLTVYNRKEHTLACLNHLFSQNISGYQVDVYMTDDGCTDGTSEIVKQKFPSVKIIRGNGNLFWNRGMNMAWKKASKTKNYDYYLWLNDDTIINHDTLSCLTQTSETFQNKAIIIGTTSAVQNHSKITYGGYTKNSSLIVPSKQPNQCNYFNGNIVLIPKYVYQKVGMNDPIFHHSLGDIDYGLRASKIGIKSIVAPNILGVCDEHEEPPLWYAQKSLRKRWKAFRSPLGQNPEEFFIFKKRHYGLIRACFYYFTNHLRVLCPWIWDYKLKLEGYNKRKIN